nr:hypothetical protein [Tanacetum cinerariifolium]
EGLGGGGFVVLEGKYLRESKNVCGEIRGVKKMSSTGSKFMTRGEECLEGRMVKRHLELIEELFGSRLEGIVVGMEEMPDEDC